MTRSPKLALILVVLLPLGACSSDKDNGAGSTTSVRASLAPCSQESARETTQFILKKDGFSVTCARVKKGTDVSFINGTDEPVEVSLSNSGEDDFNAELPNNGSTYPHRFDVAGTYRLTSKPDRTLTLFVTE